MGKNTGRTAAEVAAILPMFVLPGRIGGLESPLNWTPGSLAYVMCSEYA